MRIIAGALPRPAARRGSAPATRPRALRPTSDRVRESLFNLLAHGPYGDPPPPEGRRVLDLFAGTGALGLEALSRGAAQATFVDQGAAALALLRRNVARLRRRGRRPASSRATRPGSGRNPGPPFDLVFLDPPYGRGLGETALASALAGGWVAPGAPRRLGGERHPNRAPRLDPARPAPLWGDDDRDLREHRAAAELRGRMTASRRLLGQVFGFPDFRPGQEEIVDAVEAGRDVLAIMPTGGGKSLCYQLPALTRPGVTLVVSPLIALMRDQVRALRAAGVAAGALTSQSGPEETEEVFAALDAGRLKLLYMAPERLSLARHRQPAPAHRPRAPRRRRGALRQPVGPRLPPRLPAGSASSAAPPAASRPWR